MKKQKQTEDDKNKQLERLIELEQILWKQVQYNQANNINDVTLLRLYTDTSFRLLRHNTLYNKVDDNDECILDNLIYDNKNKASKRK